MVQSFSASRQILRTGESFLAWFTVMAVFTLVVGFLEAPTNLPEWPRLIGSLVYLGVLFPVFPFFGIGIWLIRRYRRFRLLVGTRSITIRGAFCMKRISFQGIKAAKWLPQRRLRVWTNRGRVSVPISDVVTHQQERLFRLLHERIDDSVQSGWEGFHWDVLQRDVNSERLKRQAFRAIRMSLVAPILGVIGGTALHFIWGYHPEIGLRGNFILFGTLAGCATSIVITFLMGWLYWLSRPD